MPHSKTLPNGYPGEIILFNFPESVYGRRMTRYMNLRGLPYSQIRVPPKMPRPLLQERLGINYRRIPVMSIGRDIYIDSRLMLSKLEEFFPEGGLKAPTSWEAGFEEILEEWVIDGGPFWRTAGCIPVSAPLVQDEAWMKDRFDGE
jgi:glutathione S-transferase